VATKTKAAQTRRLLTPAAIAASLNAMAELLSPKLADPVN